MFPDPKFLSRYSSTKPCSRGASVWTQTGEGKRHRRGETAPGGTGGRGFVPLRAETKISRAISEL